MAKEIRLTASAVIKRDDSYLMVRDRETGLWSMPGGKIEYMESPKDAIKRESLEEIGRVVNVKGLIGIYQFLSSRNNWVTDFSYLCSISGNPRIVRPKEISDLRWFKLDELYSLSKNNQLRAGRAQIGVIEDYAEGKGFLPSNAVTSLRK